MRISDWSSDVCSSDLRLPGSGLLAPAPHGRSLRAQSKARSFRIKHAEATRNWRGSEDSGRLGTKSVLEPRVGARITRASFWSGDRKHCRQREAQCGRLEAFWRLIVRSEEHTSELQSLMRISYAVFCLKKKNKTHNNTSDIY